MATASELRLFVQILAWLVTIQTVYQTNIKCQCDIPCVTSHDVILYSTVVGIEIDKQVYYKYAIFIQHTIIKCNTFFFEICVCAFMRYARMQDIL